MKKSAELVKELKTKVANIQANLSKENDPVRRERLIESYITFSTMLVKELEGSVE